MIIDESVKVIQLVLYFFFFVKTQPFVNNVTSDNYIISAGLVRGEGQRGTKYWGLACSEKPGRINALEKLSYVAMYSICLLAGNSLTKTP